MFQKSVILNLLEPVITRIGTASAAALVGYGMATSGQVAVAQGVTAVLLFCVDLLTRKFLKVRS